MGKKSIIGVTPDIHRGSRIPSRVPGERILFMWDYYLGALVEFGAVPVLLPVTEDRSDIRAMVSRLDGILLAPGNFDLPPELFGEEKKPWLGPVKADVSRFECELTREAAKKDLPVLGICGGMQTINVAFGGTLFQDIYKERSKTRNHNQKTRQDKLFHQVTVHSGTKLMKAITGRKGKKNLKLRVNSTHHQAIRDVAEGFGVNCVATDGIIEGIESPNHSFLLGVQWHPELLYKRFENHAAIFKAFVKAASNR